MGNDKAAIRLFNGPYYSQRADKLLAFIRSMSALNYGPNFRNNVI